MQNTLTTQLPFLGVSQNPQVDALRNGVDILIATPEDY
jgi:superfamily II DNA/RNA helicase